MHSMMVYTTYEEVQRYCKLHGNVATFWLILQPLGHFFWQSKHAHVKLKELLKVILEVCSTGVVAKSVATETLQEPMTACRRHTSTS